MSRKSAAAIAGILSLIAHAGVMAGIWPSRHANALLSTMEIADIQLATGIIEAIGVEDTPRPLLAVTALPLDSMVNGSEFQPIIPIQALLTAPDSPKGTKVPATGSPAPPPGPVASTHFFNVPAKGETVVYVLDCSASMGLQGRLARAVAEVQRSISELPPTARFQVVSYAKASELLRINGRSGLLKAEPITIKAASDQLARLRAEGSTDHLRAMRAALALNPAVIFLLTDEDDLALADVTTLTRWNQSRSIIHTFCLVEPTGSSSPLRQLAQSNRGVFHVVLR